MIARNLLESKPIRAVFVYLDENNDDARKDMMRLMGLVRFLCKNILTN